MVRHLKEAGTVPLRTLGVSLAPLARIGVAGSLALERAGQHTGITQLATCIVHGINPISIPETSLVVWDPDGLAGRKAGHIHGITIGTP